MSSYCDGLQSNPSNAVDSHQITDEKIKKKFFGTMKPQPRDYLINQNYGTILVICLILMIIYYHVFMIFYPLMIDIHSKHEYFNEQLQIENEKINKLKENILKLKRDSYNVDKHNITCQKCWSYIRKLDFDYIINYVVECNRPIKQLYNDTLYPLQFLFILMCAFNTICTAMIFKEPTKLFFTSNLFTLICQCIYGELFIKDKPNVYYTLIFGVGIFLFSVFLLIKMLLTLLNILHYQRMKHILASESLPQIS